MRPRQSGVALLATILVVALAAILIAGLLDRGMIGQARALQQARTAQAYAFQHGLELWAGRILRDDRERDPVDSRADAWAQAMPPLILPEGMINGRMHDLDGCLNLNALASSSSALAAQRFERLLRVLDLDLRLVDAITDWVDGDGTAGASGAEDALYATLDPPRRAANRPFAHVSELRAVAGVDARVYERLAPHVCARADTPLNVNTATPEVLMSLHDDITPPLARRLHSDGRARFHSVAGDAGSFAQVLQEAGVIGVDLRGLDVVSRHFVAEGDLLIGEVPVRLYSVMERRDDGRIVVVARSQGRF